MQYFFLIVDYCHWANCISECYFLLLSIKHINLRVLSNQQDAVTAVSNIHENVFYSKYLGHWYLLKWTIFMLDSVCKMRTEVSLYLRSVSRGMSVCLCGQCFDVTLGTLCVQFDQLSPIDPPPWRHDCQRYNAWRQHAVDVRIWKNRISRTGHSGHSGQIGQLTDCNINSYIQNAMWLMLLQYYVHCAQLSVDIAWHSDDVMLSPCW